MREPLGLAARLCAVAPVLQSFRHHARMDRLSLFGLFAVTAMLVSYAFEKRSHWFVLAFAASCVLGSIYGFLQGAWPFGLVETIWALVAVRRWAIARSAG
jgi:hypothetical protein